MIGPVTKDLCEGSTRMTRRTIVKASNTILMTVISAAVLAGTVGCVERRVVAVPVYQPAPGYPPPPPPSQPPVVYQPQTTYQPQVAPQSAPPVQPVQPGNPPVALPQGSPGEASGVQQAVPEVQQPAPPLTQPPPAQVEYVPVAPGPDYYWVGGYWVWRGRWVWSPGAYVVRPRPNAIWVGGRWERRRGRSVWIGGYWR